jgi:hypothetical protein
MSKYTIEVSKEIWDEYVKLKSELGKIGWNDISDDQILWAMIWGFFDSLQHMKHNHWHHSHDHGGWCCGECDGECDK